MTQTSPATASHSADPEWHSGGPGKSAYQDYRWQCACGQRYGNATPQAGDVNGQHAAHLAAVARH